MAEKLPFQQIQYELVNNDRWNITNPSFLKVKSEIVRKLFDLGDLKLPAEVFLMNVRAVNYKYDEKNGKYIVPWTKTKYTGPFGLISWEKKQKIVKTRNQLLVLTHPESSEEYVYQCNLEDQRPTSTAKNSLRIQGMEDVKLFLFQDEIWCSWNSLDHFSFWERQGCQIGIGKIEYDLKSGHCSVTKPIYLPRHVSFEKNWLPWSLANSSDLYFIYSCKPLQMIHFQQNSQGFQFKKIITHGYQEKKKLTSCNFISHFRNSAGPVPWAAGFLLIVHETYRLKSLVYEHRFLWYDSHWQLQKVSPRFYLEEKGQIEYINGCIAFEGHIYITFGIRDCQAKLGKIHARTVNQLLGLDFGDI